MFNFLWKFALGLVCALVSIYLLVYLGLAAWLGYLVATGGL